MWASLILLLVLLEGISCQSVPGTLINRKEVITEEHGVVAADDGRCSQIGSTILQRGGHAVDASIAAAFCLGVVSPASSGIGAGGLMLIRSSNGLVEAYDMRETAPAAASRDMYANDPSAKEQGGLAVGVPGQVLGLYQVWQKYGKLPWKELVEPAIALAGLGFKISPYLYYQMTQTEAAIRQDEGLREKFMEYGELLKIGDIVRDVKLARTLTEIAIHGPSVFYDGPVGVDLVHDIREKGGIITMEDLKGYVVKQRKPIFAKVMNHEIFTMPPPSSGGVGLIMVLNVLAQYGSAEALSGTLGLHRLVEAMKHMYAERTNLGDPDFVNVEPVISQMLSLKFAREVKNRINDSTTHDPNFYLERYNQTIDHGTSHMSVVDSERNAVGLTSTVNNFFGAWFRSRRTGMILNNQMDDFSIPSNTTSNTTMPPAPANFIVPHKRPLSSTMPTIILKNGQLNAVIGASGGPRIIPANIQVFLNHFVHNMDPFSAILAPRVYHRLIPNFVEYEKWDTVSGDHIEVSLRDRLGLASKGHVLQALAFGAKCQFVVQHLPIMAKGKSIIMGNLTAVSDPRKGGFPAGY
ncbi:hypothetical protein AMTRI_Chr03g51960 [Amborella trichopoda]